MRKKGKNTLVVLLKNLHHHLQLQNLKILKNTNQRNNILDLMNQEALTLKKRKLLIKEREKRRNIMTKNIKKTKNNMKRVMITKSQVNTKNMQEKNIKNQANMKIEAIIFMMKKETFSKVKDG